MHRALYAESSGSACLENSIYLEPVNEKHGSSSARQKQNTSLKWKFAGKEGDLLEESGLPGGRKFQEQNSQV